MPSSTRVRLPALPVAEALPALRRALADAGCAVLSAPPGSGKTTLAPLLLLDEPWLTGRKIVILEPRRLAARMAAARMASLLGERVGETVGYRIRFERKVSARTRIEVVTEGLLTRRLQDEPELAGVGLVIFDEFHERSLDADLALALTLDACAALNPDLRVLVMSATLDTGRVAELIGRGSGQSVIPARDWRGSSDRDVLNPAPVVTAGGRLFPVEIRHRPPKADSDLPAAVAGGVRAALTETEGDVLAFLPGGREIRATQRLLAARAAGIRIHPLYGDLPGAEQDAALRPAPDGARKVILATNLAQTSLTVEGVTAVVDGGYARVARFDLGAGANRLDTVRVSRAATEQRAGRAGRLAPGVCYRLWSKEQQGRLPAHDTPEILSADVTRFALELAAWGIADPGRLKLLDQPPQANWRYARELLAELEAVDAQGRITAHGRELARLPVAPRLGHMLLRAAREGLGATAAWVAAALEARAPAQGVDLVEHLHGLRSTQGPDAARAREAVRQLLQLSASSPLPRAARATSPARGAVKLSFPSPSPLPPRGGGVGGEGAFDEAMIGRVVAWAYPERIARRRAGQEDVYLCEDGGEARLPERDALAPNELARSDLIRREWLAVAHWDPARGRRIRLAAPLDPADIERDHAGRVRERDEVRWDGQQQAVVAETQRRLGAIVLAHRPLGAQASETVRAAMLEGIHQMGLASLPWTGAARQWQARLLSLRAWRPDEDWPDVSDERLSETLEEWLAPHLDGVTRSAHLARLDLPGILGVRLDYARSRRFAQLAPTHLQVPSGSRVALQYFADGAPPALAVKLQELFGWTETPRVNDGRTKIALHLLSPARRPIQVTQDLASFWARTYPEVKKELKGRYPKHPWPDDPLRAIPTARVKRHT